MMSVKSKNIHVLPTDGKKASYLAFDRNKKLRFSEWSHPYASVGGWVALHIYITNSEEIKEGDWCLNEDDFDKHLLFKADSLFFDTGLEAKKIILTTDQDLIKDGVQAIDDEFLEWFVNNPSCEFVKTLWTIPAYKIEKEYMIEFTKKETLGKAAEKYAKKTYRMLNETELEYPIEDFVSGAKWQQEQIGKSEFLQRLRATKSDAEARRLIFEQFKNK